MLVASEELGMGESSISLRLPKLSSTCCPVESSADFLLMISCSRDFPSSLVCNARHNNI